MIRTPLQVLKSRWRAPLIFFQVYLSVTVWLFFYGPWPWQIDNPLQVFAFLAAAQVAIAIGYLRSWKRVRASQTLAFPRDNVANGTRFLKAALVVTVLLAIPTSLSRTGSAIPNAVEGLRNTGVVYNENFERLEVGNPFVVVEYLRMLVSPWLTAAFPLTVFYWGRLSWSVRLVALAAIGFNLSMYLATGTNKGIADVTVTLPWLVFLAAAVGIAQPKSFKLKVSIASVAFFAAFLYFFGAGQQQRSGSGSGSEYGTFFTGISVLQSDTNNFISSLLPEALRVIFEAISRYVVHGYYALSLSFQTDTPSTLGLGNSMFLARNADLVAGSNYFVNQSIPGVLDRDFGWGMFLLWHSIYPWLASDFGFAGTLVVMGALAYLLGLSWGKTLTTASAPWVVLLYLLIILFFYVPANNQVFQSGETCVAFFAVLIWALRSESRPSRVPARAALQRSP